VKSTCTITGKARRKGGEKIKKNLGRKRKE
jgi:hypothetical protein